MLHINLFETLNDKENFLGKLSDCNSPRNKMLELAKHQEMKLKCY